MIKEQYNQLPRTTFRWMKVNHLELEPKTSEHAAAYAPAERHEGKVDVQFYNNPGTFDLGDFTGANKESLAEVLQHSQTGCLVETQAGETATVWLSYAISDDMPALTGQLHIKAGAGSRLKVNLAFEGDPADGQVNFLNVVEAADGAHVKICKMQLHGKNVRHVEHRYAQAGKQALVDYVSAEVGARETVVYYKTDLPADEGTFRSNAMYLGSDNQVFDFSYWVPQQGIKTNTDIVTTGALMDKSKKYFRGTIDFLRGGKKAVGSESDVCLLLSPDVHSISVPLLLCKEDDVVGNHASSAGQIDKDKLFYLMSRGFSEAGAQLLIVESNIRPVIDMLDDDAMENKVLQTVRRKMRHCEKKGDCHGKCTQRFPHLE